MTAKYDESSIKVLKGLEGVRKRPAMYVGDTSTSGFHHLVWEIVDNAIDEAVAGFCKNIAIKFTVDGRVQVVDDGRGIPVKNHPTEKIPTVDVVLTMLHSGGKFGGADTRYRTSGGLHGVGAAVVNALSEHMMVTIKRDGKIYVREYERAKPTKKDVDVVGSCPKRETGTEVIFKPDKTIFSRCEFDKEVIQRRLRELAFLNAGLRIKLFWFDGTEEEFCSADGLNGYVKYLTRDSKLIHEPIRIQSTDVEGCEVDVAFVYDDQFESQIHSFANNIATHEGGVHYNAALDALCKAIEDHASSELKRLKLKVNKSDVVEGLTLIVSVRVEEPQFGGQTKTKLNNEDLRWPFGEWIQKQITKQFKKDKRFADTVVVKIIDAIKTRDAARKARDIQRKKSVVSVLTGKLKNCTSKDPTLCELFIVEGDSAGGTAVDARNRQFQAILPLRGKPLNVYSRPLGRCLTNKEISTLIAALNVTVTPRDVLIDDLRYHKVILLADADPDGGHITCLLMTMFHKFMRKLIEAGHLYVCDLPLFRVTCRGKSQYIKDAAALDEFKTEHKDARIEVSRFKGLGEMSVDELEETAMNPNTRVLRQVQIEDQIQAREVIDRLMGEDIQARKDFLAKALKFDDIV